MGSQSRASSATQASSESLNLRETKGSSASQRSRENPGSSENQGSDQAQDSREALLFAVRSLLPRRAWHHVSVQLICETAKVSRSTFYAHFDDKQSLLDFTFDALKKRLLEKVPERGLDTYGNFCCLPRLVSHMHGHLPLFNRNRSSPSGPLLFAQFKRVVKEVMYLETLTSKKVGKIPSHKLDFVVGGIFGILENWCEQGCALPDAEVLEQLDEQVNQALA